MIWIDKEPPLLPYQRYTKEEIEKLFAKPGVRLMICNQTRGKSVVPFFSPSGVKLEWVDHTLPYVDPSDKGDNVDEI